MNMQTNPSLISATKADIALVRHRNRCFALPSGVLPADLDDPLVRENPQLVSDTTEGGVVHQIDETARRQKVEFTGWMPQFRFFGNCGAHPQFMSAMKSPPPGWSFVQSAPLRAFRPDVLWDTDLVRLLDRLWRNYNLGEIALGRPDPVLVTNEYRLTKRHIFLYDGTYHAVREPFFDPARHVDNPDVLTASDLPSLFTEIDRVYYHGQPLGISPSKILPVVAQFYGLEIEIFHYMEVFFVWPRRWGEFNGREVFTDSLSVPLRPEDRRPLPDGRRNTAAVTRELVLKALRNGARWRDIRAFLDTRDMEFNRAFHTDAPVAFVPSVPYLMTRKPWLIEVEDATTLFFPFINNGRTADLDIRAEPSFPVIKALLQTTPCKFVLSHVKSTADGLVTMFDDERIARKIAHIPLGYPLPPFQARLRDKGRDEPFNLLFTSSWHQDEVGFYLRGGLDTLTAFDELAERHSNLHLTIRCQMPGGPAGELFTRLVEKYGPRIRHIAGFLPAEEWRAMILDTDAFLLPAARIHVVSLLEAMAYGLPVITSDGWAIEEYVTDGETGMIMRGRYGTVSWMDRKTGVLREDYRGMYEVTPGIVRQMTEAVEGLIADPDLRRRLGHNAREAVRTRFTLEQWNASLGRLFEQAAGLKTAR